MSKKTRSVQWCDRELVKAPFFYALCLDDKSFREELKRLNIKKKDWPAYVNNWHSQATCHFLENKNKSEISAIICLKNWEDKEDIAVYGLLVHEAAHLWQQVRDLYGEASPSIEFEAYALQNLSQNLFRQFKDQTK